MRRILLTICFAFGALSSAYAYGENTNPNFRDRLIHDDLIYLAFGGALYGSGGGGALVDAYNITKIIPKSFKAKLLPVDRAEDDAIYVVAGGIGAPSAVRQRSPELIEAAAKSAKRLGELSGGKLGGILSVETGPINSILAAALSSNLNLPLIDADGAGRAVPTLSHLTYAHEADISIAPIVLTSLSGEQIILYPKNPEEADSMIRDIIQKPSWGSVAGLALWSQTGKQLKSSKIIRDTFSRAREIGQLLVLSVDGYWDPVLRNLRAHKELYEYYLGNIVGFETKKEHGFDFLEIKVETDFRCHESYASQSPLKCRYLGVGETEKHILTIRAINENLLMEERLDDSKDQDKVIVVSPHLISYAVRSDALGKSMLIPITNGDTDAMKKAAAEKAQIIVHVLYAHPRLYELTPIFLKYLKDNMGYEGGLVPPAPALNQ